MMTEIYTQRELVSQACLQATFEKGRELVMCSSRQREYAVPFIFKGCSSVLKGYQGSGQMIHTVSLEIDKGSVSVRGRRHPMREVYYLQKLADRYALSSNVAGLDLAGMPLYFAHMIMENAYEYINVKHLPPDKHCWPPFTGFTSSSVLHPLHAQTNSI